MCINKRVAHRTSDSWWHAYIHLVKIYNVSDLQLMAYAEGFHQSMELLGSQFCSCLFYQLWIKNLDNIITNLWVVSLHTSFYTQTLAIQEAINTYSLPQFSTFSSICSLLDIHADLTSLQKTSWSYSKLLLKSRGQTILPTFTEKALWRLGNK